MVEKIRKYIETHRLLSPGDTIVVGLSGGADSVALLTILVRIGYTCLAAHCNFHLRGEESERDQLFAEETARKLNVDFYHTSFQTTVYARRKGISIEMAARDLRYAWFEQLRKEHQAQAIAVAHHRDDSVETFLLNLSRGSGIHGLCGIRPKNGYIVRPLLDIGREEILAYLTQEHLTYVTDSTNKSDEYTRNFLRLRLIPLWERVNPALKKTIARTAANLSEAEALYRYAIEQAKVDVLDAEGRLSIEKLLRYPSPKTILYEWLTPYGFTSETADSIMEALGAESGKTFYPPGEQYVLLKDRGFLIISPRIEKDKQVYPLQINESVDTPISLSLKRMERDNSGFFIAKSPDYAYFDFDRLTLPLYLRKWQPGDWFVPFGMEGRKKLSDYFSDHKFSRLQKEQAWLLCSGSDIIWIVGERADNRFKVSKTTKSVLIVIFSQENS